MPELRKDPVTSRWVIIATERGRKPCEYVVDRTPTEEPVYCPFCYGGEDKTPHEVLSYRETDSAPNDTGWRVRVVPNKFPAVRREGEVRKRGDGIYDCMNAVGFHEVIVEHPDHDATFDQYSTEQVALILRAYQERYLDILRDPRLQYVLIFKNSGKAAGASLRHPHSQLIAVPVVPKRVAEELAGARDYYRWKERCVFCDMIRQELETGERVLASNERFICIAPFASRFPFELQVLPRDHRSDFGTMTDDDRLALAELLRDSLSRLLRTLKHPPYNFILHTAPARSPDLDYYHWHIEIVPRLVRIAGFQWCSGFYINPTPPESATDLLLNGCEKEGEN